MGELFFARFAQWFINHGRSRKMESSVLILSIRIGAIYALSRELSYHQLLEFPRILIFVLSGICAHILVPPHTHGHKYFYDTNMGVCVCRAKVSKVYFPKVYSLIILSLFNSLEGKFMKFFLCTLPRVICTK